MPRIVRQDRRRNVRTTRPLWLDIDRVSYLAENWSLSGILIREALADAEPNQRVMLRLSLDPITGSPFAYVFARIVDRNERGTVLVFNELSAQVFDLLSEAMFRRPSYSQSVGTRIAAG